MSAAPGSTLSSESIKSPGREIAGIAVPVSLEMVIQLVLGFINQVIVGTLGAVSVAAVGLSGSLGFLFFITLGALGSGTSILVARRAGAGDRHGVNTVMTVTTALSIVLGVLITVLVYFVAGPLLGLAGGEAAVTRVATPYLQVLMVSLVPGMMGWVYSGALRSLGHARTPLVATILSVAIESALAYSLVFGIGPFPELGVVGAAWAIVVANTFKAVYLAAQIYGPRHLAELHIPHPRSWREVAAPLLTLTAPIAFTEFAWSLGGFLYAAVFARVGTKALAASQIAANLESVFFIASFGLMSAATVFIGRSLGAGDPAAAQRWLQRILRAGLVTAVTSGALYALSALAVPGLFPRVGAEVQQLAVIGILITAVSQVMKVRNMIIGGGVLPGTGDARGVLIGDVVGAFVVGLPLAIFLGLYTPLGAWGVFIARGLEEVGKFIIFEWRRRRLDWPRLAHEQAGSAVIAAH
ncbi:MATE family efflux transporter [Deinococcus sp.]|uniref:MATE family efflux transporter n=1 Tax=Deinococcus sp. TaxID=47478 RepID=UPI002869D17D|nr:MATE family efflux transporter [Deinococcus sp.]